MRKNQIIKFMSILIGLSLCINNFAAVVSDNDGSAFITKAEFEALKKDFESQIKEYQNSIDSKVDGAIAGYLASIKFAKKEQIDFKVQQKRWKSINSVEQVDGAIGLNFFAMFYARIANNRTSTNVAPNGLLNFSYEPTPAKGIIFNTEYSDNYNGKIGVIKGYGERKDYQTMTSVAYFPSANQNVTNMTARIKGYQLNWWTDDINIDTELPTERTYYDKHGVERVSATAPNSPDGWGTIAFGVNSGNTSWFGAKTKAGNGGVQKVVNVKNNDLYLVNDEEVKTLIDENRINGISLIPQTDEYKDFIVKDLKIEADVELINNTQDSYFNVSNTNNGMVRALNITDTWAGTNYYRAYLNTNLETATQDIGWNTGAGNSHKGYNRLLYVSHVYQPTKICTELFTDDDEFNNWLQSIVNAPDDAYAKFDKEGETVVCYNLRYGLPIIHRFEKNAKYTLKLTNNDKDNDLNVKVYNKLTTTKFSDVVGLETNKSDKDNNNAVKVPKGSTIEFEFEVSNDNSPIFLKCNDNADITLVSVYQETEGV